MLSEDKRVRVLIICVCLFTALILGFSVFNAWSLNADSQADSEQSVNEVASQISYTANTQIDANKNASRDVSAAIEFFLSNSRGTEVTTGFLQQYLEGLNKSTTFDYYVLQLQGQQDIVVGQIGETIQKELDQDYSKFDDLNAASRAIAKDETVAYVEGDNLCYTTPLHQDGQIIGVFTGGFNSTVISDLISKNVLPKDAQTEIITNDGLVLVDSVEFGMSTHDKILSIITEEQETALINNVKNFQTGTMRITVSMSEVYYLSYEPLSGENWMLITLVPTDSINGVYNLHAFIGILTAVATAIVFTIVIILYLKHEQKHRKNLEKIAYVDNTTAGNNHEKFRQLYHELQDNCDPTEYTIVMLDIRDFRLINSIVGYRVGDEILWFTLDAINNNITAEDHEFAARLEMDHFIICMHEKDPDIIEARIKTILAAVNTQRMNKTFGFKVEFTQSACYVESPETTVDELIDRVRAAQKAQDPGKLNQLAVYSEELGDNLQRQRTIDRVAAKALENGEFEIYLQPKVSLHKNKVVGAEALVRWNSKEHGLVYPNDFIPILEQSGRIQKLDEFVFEEVCRWLDSRKKQNKSLIKVSVNVSRTHLWRKDFLADYVEIIKKYDVDHKNIEFEFTETALMEESNLQKLKWLIKRIHDEGFSCAVDDFGVGYSSLSLINEMDVDTLKFDRSFFINLEDPKSQKIAKALLGMATELHLDSVVEGIETQEQIDILKNSDFDVVQGYYYSKPLPKAEFEKWLEDFGK